MEFGIGSLSNAGVGFSSVKPMNYSIDNQSITSTSFVEAMKGLSGSESVGVVSPVRYPNAEYVSPLEKADRTMKMSAAYNDIAETIEGTSVEYNRSGEASGYEMLGRSVDFYV